MKISQLFGRGGPVVSFEFFPPKTAEGVEQLYRTVEELRPCRPSFVSVTYGAGGSTRDRTTRVTSEIARTTTLTPVAHLTCVGASRADLRRVVGGYADAGVRTVMALRGDPPGGPGTPWTAHPEGLDHAADLVRLVREVSAFDVGVAAFPDGHPESPDLDHDARVLAAKADAGAAFAVTQFFFDPAAYFRLVDRLDALGCRIPVIPGIMPVTNVGQLTRFAQLSGTPVPARIVERLTAVADDVRAVRQVGVEVAIELSRALLDGGAPGLHFYTLNRSTATLEVLHDLAPASAATGS